MGYRGAEVCVLKRCFWSGFCGKRSDVMQFYTKCDLPFAFDANPPA